MPKTVVMVVQILVSLLEDIVNGIVDPSARAAACARLDEMKEEIRKLGISLEGGYGDNAKE